MKPQSAWSANWQASQGRATTAYQEGVQQTNADWAGNLLRQKSVMVQNWQTAVQSPTYDQHVTAVGNNGWKSATVAKAGNFSMGFSAGASKQAVAAGKLFNAMTNIVGSLPPRGTYEQNKLRSTSVMDQLHSLKGSLGAK